MDVEVAAAGAKGHGVFALREFVRGETVIVGRAIDYPPRRTRMSVQVDWGQHVEMDAPATLLNHSCVPNLGVRGNAWSAYDFVALRGIPAGEELAFDYAMTEHSSGRTVVMLLWRRALSGGNPAVERPRRRVARAERELDRTVSSGCPGSHHRPIWNAAGPSMKVCVLYCSDEVSPEGVPAPARAPIELAEYGPGHEYAYHELTKATAVRDLRRLAGGDFDVFLNLCDGAWDEARPGIEVVGALQRLELAFTGAGTAFYEPTREAMKLVCHYLDIGFRAGS